MTMSASLRWRIVGARVVHELGIAGLLGCVLIGVSLVAGARAWDKRHSPAATHEDVVLGAPSEDVRPAAPPPLRLTSRGEVALVQTAIRTAAVQEGLAWSSADYRLVDGTETTPAALEVRASLKGTYPQVRAALVEWLRNTPGLTIRQLSISRASSDAVEVESKLALVVYLDAPRSPRAAQPKGAP